MKMWSFFSRDPAKDFHYDIGEKITGLENKSIWAIHHGKKKGTGEPVTIFTFDVKSSSESQVQVAKGAFKRIKTLRHPNIVSFLDGVETDKVIYFATEAVLPLENYLNESEENRNLMSISWGIHQVAKGLSFLINDCNLIHNNVCLSSVFVNQAGEWKLGGVDYMYPAQGQDSVPPVKILPLLDRYDPPEKAENRRGARTEKWSTDMWGLGCLIWEVFNGPLTQTSALKSVGKIPKSLVPNYCELVGANPKSRPNPAKFIESCRTGNGFMQNSFVKTMLFLDEIQIKDQSEKTKFFANLAPSLDEFPKAFCKNKILPQLLNAFEYGDAGSHILAPLFKIGKFLDAEEYQNRIVPCVVKLFTSPDRATRVKLLQQIDTFVEYLQSATVNDKIFPHIIHGFTDTNPVVRESTIKAIVFIAPKLNYKNLNEEVMKHFARLQAKDDQGGIRTNTTVCLGKIACHLNPQVRQKMISSAFLRALKDPFPPARQAGILGMVSTQNFFTLNEIAQRLLPAMCSMTRDPEKGVRDQAFRGIKCFVEKLEKVSENPELEAEMEKDVLSGGSSVSSSAASWAGWAVTGVSSLTSKLYKKDGTRQKATGPPGPAKNVGELPKKPTPKPVTDNPSAPEPSQTEEETGWDEEGWGEIDDTPDIDEESSEPRATDGWDDNDEEDWGSLEDTAPKSAGPEKSSGNSMKLGSKKEVDDWGGDFGNEFVSTEDSGLTMAGEYNWGNTTETGQEDFFSSAMGLPKQKPAKTKPKSSPSSSRSSPAPSSGLASQQKASKVESGWDVEDSGWGTDEWGPVGSTNKTTVQSRPAKQKSPSPPQDTSGWDQSGWGDGDDWGAAGTNKIDEARRKKEEREEKRLQRQREIEERRAARKGGGALKLGAKKTALD
ncbi:N-terminal kinase-like protein isoform X1 [Saccostrea echinata]|uniref:N-terminal kinase-like protein isoform X1 n=1 Tax=Saccostrea echinata TaxID=191078 RepID=UPI002A83C2B1|nr:N-terminal kinase-like protein isoform X1 [Saccostrea echinata]